jgi:hypothetical protein
MATISYRTHTPKHFAAEGCAPTFGYRNYRFEKRNYLVLMAKKKIVFINSTNHCEPVYKMGKTGDVILCNTRPPPEGGTGNAATIILPVASDNKGRTVTIKDVGAYLTENGITVQRALPDVIDAGSTAITFTIPGEYRTFISDGKHTWYQVG